ncbi:hypothetical protein PRK78_001466 [Emydomyces testavorans]|uniref:F-box domain-containing protein n=1 Tax=Emydomyces testavorans TaxID=2070801 RepID=A0AAF0DE51_9EURO|nr:hypothetical protein PRK78_001466 [Emydomyces testavorans]
MEPAKSAVKHTPELLESVLLQMDMRTLLTSAQLVCRHWHTMINESPALQKALFFKAQENAPNNAKQIINPLLAEVFSPFFTWESARESENPRRGPTQGVFDNLPLTKNKDAFLRKGASWRRMLVMQPPARSMGVITYTNALVSERLNWKILEWVDTSGSDETENKDPREPGVSRIEGIRMSMLYDQAFQGHMNYAPYPFWICWLGKVPPALHGTGIGVASGTAPRELLSRAAESSEVVLYGGYGVPCGCSRRRDKWHEGFQCEEFKSRADPISKLMSNLYSNSTDHWTEYPA